MVGADRACGFGHGSRYRAAARRKPRAGEAGAGGDGKYRIVGLQKLIEHSGCPQQNISAENIGFILAPRLNAVGRLEHAQSAVELLVTDDAAKADMVAEQLNAENALRQEISRKIFIEAEAMLAQQERIETAIVLAKEAGMPA